MSHGQFVISCFSVTAVRKKVPQLSVVPVQTTNIPPKEVVVYTKQTQTTTTGHDVRDGKLFCAFYYHIKCVSLYILKLQCLFS